MIGLREALTDHWQLGLLGAALLSQYVQTWWRKSRRAVALRWPFTQGRIETAKVRTTESDVKIRFSRKTDTSYVAELDYSYSVQGEFYSGVYERAFSSEESAWNFTEGLEGSLIYVHFKPDRPQQSIIGDEEIDKLVALKPPVMPDPSDLGSLSPALSPFLRPFLVPFLVLAASGLVISLWVHVSALMGRLVLPERYFAVLHVGIFVVWLPTIFVSNQLTKEYKTKDMWKASLRGSPEWMERMVYGFGLYAMLNFAIFMFQAPQEGTGGPPDPVAWRGFSGHWMLFYSVAMATLYSALHATERGWRCIKGHSAAPSSKYCDQCGQPVRRFG